MAGDGVKTAKKWYKSKTLLVNAVVAAGGVLNSVVPIMTPAEAVITGTILVPALNMYLRSITNQALTK
jgi:hypothetical protein